MKKLTLSLLLLIAANVGAMAKSVVFTLTNGTKVYYLLDGVTDPVLRFVDGKMTVNADTYEFSGIKNFFISNEDDPNAIEEVLTKKNISFKNNMVVVNAPGVKNVTVYSVGGAAVKTDVTKSGDVVTVALDALPAGNYVVNVDGVSFKVSKK